MTQKNIRAAVRATQFVADYAPESQEDELTRGAWERPRKDQRPPAKPEPPLNNPPYSYEQNTYSQQPQHTGAPIQYQMLQPYYDPNRVNAPNSNGMYGGQASSGGAYYGPPPGNGGYGWQPPGNGGHGGQLPSNGGYSAQYSGQPPPSPAAQSQYVQYQSPQAPDSSLRPVYGQGANSAPQGHAPFPPPPLSRATTTGSYMSAAPPEPRYCQWHGKVTEWPCRQCPLPRY